jgi:hypothetical protein
MDWWAAGLAGALCLTMALAERVLSGSDLQRWLATLTHPRSYAPLWVWLIAAVMTNVIQGVLRIGVFAWA